MLPTMVVKYSEAISISIVKTMPIGDGSSNDNNWKTFQWMMIVDYGMDADHANDADDYGYDCEDDDADFVFRQDVDGFYC